MRILYHLTVLPPKMPRAEALSQEIAALRKNFSGDLNYLNPNIDSPIYLPRLAFGFPQLLTLRQRETGFSLHHLYNPDPFPFPVVHFLRRPVVYTVSSGVGLGRPAVSYFRRLAAIAVADERSLKRLRGWGLDNVHLVRPGIDISRFHHQPTPLKAGQPIRLMVGSAPWTEAQFSSKGVDALLTAARQNPDLHLVFLWRGVLFEEMKARIAAQNLGQQVSLINREVDVSAVLGEVHASITLAEGPGIIKSYPHSLLDSLAGGKPVLVSQAIAMADYVADRGCGVVVERVTAGAILTALEKLRLRYEAFCRVARTAGQRDFSQGAMVASYRRVYEQVAGR